VGRFGPSLPSPDLAPSDYHLFGKLKEHIVGQKFDDDDETKGEVLRWLNEQAAEFCDSVIKKLVPRLKKCIEKHGDYVENINMCSQLVVSHYQNKMLSVFFLAIVSLLSEFPSYIFFSNIKGIRRNIF
jgi:hypothetical protein